MSNYFSMDILTPTNTGTFSGMVFKNIPIWNIPARMVSLPLPMMMFVGAGRSIKPVNSQECQVLPAAAVASKLARQLQDNSVGIRLTGSSIRFQKFLALDIQSGLGHVVLDLGTINTIATTFPSAVSVDPARWSALNSRYITTLDLDQRSEFYGPPGTFDHNTLQLGELTKDVGSVWITLQAIPGNIITPTQCRGPVTTIDGALDTISGCPCNQTTFPTQEKAFFPEC
ncbi:hypothetical protein M422DRAFT_239182 [Sphaerobolus stellatus SS14]|nr:hypothetical protein M422DRAFT_239182 [Sphaerobolus stellatus SS14]